MAVGRIRREFGKMRSGPKTNTGFRQWTSRPTIVENPVAMPTRPKRPVIALLLSAVALHGTASGDTSDARCDIFAPGADRAPETLSCTFSQRQGHVTIARSDGIVHDLTPSVETPGHYLDQNGRPAYRQDDLGSEGLVFRLNEAIVYVYWDTSALEPQPAGSDPTWPFTTQDYDATTLLRCRMAGAAEFGQCPAGILRMEKQQASIVLLSPGGERFTINFMSDYVNATNRDVSATLSGDTWTVTVDEDEIYEVPQAAITGG